LGRGKETADQGYINISPTGLRYCPGKVARRSHDWEKVFHSVEYVVEWGLKHRSLEGITAVGVDEIAWKKGHKYLTLVYQINNGAVRLLWIGKDRTEKTFHGFFDKLGAEKAKLIEYVCSDMWKAYLKVIKERIPQWTDTTLLQGSTRLSIRSVPESTNK
jgi:hypothetical protein